MLFRSRFRAAREAAGLRAVWLHCNYLPNLAHADDEQWEKSIGAVTNALTVAHHAGANGVVLHTGSHKGQGIEAVLSRVAGALERIFEAAPGDCLLALENAEGQGGTIGKSWNELGQIARALRLPQWNPSEGLQRRLWLVKYVAAALVLGLGFADSALATGATEIEPFKTAITAHFDRAWPFVAYAGALLALGLFTERAYCRFLCPLGGTLALLDRLHIVNLLRRRPECGSPCHLCETSCPVKAIERSGKIKMAECFQCLDCQVEYYDDERCPPLAKTRKLKLRGGPAGATAPAAAE